MKQKIFGTCLLAICFCSMAKAQQVEKNDELGEILRMVAAANDIPFLSFEMKIVVEDSALAPGFEPQADTIKGTYRQNEGRYWMMLDSVEYVQGFMYNLALYHSDKLISVGRPSINNPALQLSLLDSTFQEVHVKNMSVTQINPEVRLFKIYFNSQSPYSGYEMNYDNNTYKVNSITYYLKNGYERQDETTSTAKITTTFFNYGNEEFSRDYFLEEKYIYKDSQGFKTRPAYTSYQIITADDDL